MLAAVLHCGVLGAAATGLAEPPGVAGVDLNAEQRALIEQLTADKAISIARERRLADADQEKLYERLQAKDRVLRAAVARAAGNAAELGRIRKAREQIASERQALVAALAQRDQSLTAEARAYREEVTDLATSPDSRKQKALQRFADGEQREALDDLDAIADANRAGRVKAVDVADAAERRPIAVLALQARDQGRVTLAEVVRRHEQLTRLDPGMTWAWIHLARLYDEQGRLGDARTAAQSGYASSIVAGNDRDRAAVLSDLANIAVKSGDLASAKARFEESLAIVYKVAKDNPTSAAAQRDLSVSLNKLGEVALQAGDLADAKARFEVSLGIARTLAKDNPTSAAAQRDLSISLDRLGEVAIRAGDLAAAKDSFGESLGIRTKLARDNATSASAQRDLSISLDRLGSVAAQAGDLPSAKARFEASLSIRTKLAKDSPTSAAAQRDLSVSLNWLGSVAVQAGNLPEAKARFEEDLVIARKLNRIA